MRAVFRCLLTTAVLGLAWPAAAPGPAAAGETLVVGSIARNIKKEMRNFGPFIDYLAPRLGAVGITDARLYVATSAGEMVRLLQAGEVDVYIDSPFIVAAIGRQTGATPFLRRWKKGAAEYHTLFVARRDSGITSLDGLRGRVIAFDEPFSSSGYLLPKAMLIERGHRPVQVPSSDTPVPADAIGYVFSMDDINSMFWVLQGKVAACATSPQQFEKFADQNVGKFVVLAQSATIPRQAVAHRRDLDPEVVRELERVLLRMDDTEEGRAALREFQDTTRFDRFPDGVEATFAPIEAMLDRLGGDLTH